jgi:hypothetical protein
MSVYVQSQLLRMNNFFKQFLYLVIVLLAPVGVNAQLDIVNQYGFGGDGFTENPRIITSSDNGYYVLFGTSSSVGSGNIIAPAYGFSYLVLSKFDADFNLEWQKSYGGNLDDGFGWIIEVSDGILVGSASHSGISGNKTVASFGSSDGWLLKLDFDGEIIWQKGYGGTDIDNLFGLIETASGDIVMAYRSSSGISGNRTVPLKGQQDYWVVKTDSAGEIIWDYAYGSDGSDIVFGLGELSDGTIILSGSSIGATLSYDKTEPPYSTTDNWIVAIDADGSILWDKTIGGSGSDALGFLLIKQDTIYVLARSSSGISGLRTEPLKGQQDLWLTKLDKDGNIISTHYYGGDQFDQPTGIFQLNNEKLLLCAYSNSNVSYDKSEDSRGGLDYWAVIVDKNGQVINDKTLGGSDSEALSGGVLVNNSLFLAGISNSDISGDKLISKFDMGNTDTDVWIVELDATTLDVIQNNVNLLPTVYPNPVTDILSIDLSDFNQAYAIDVYDLKGVLITSKTLVQTSETVQLDFSKLASGVYTILIRSHKGTSAVKVVK